MQTHGLPNAFRKIKKKSAFRANTVLGSAVDWPC
jgi:hypothetical protein